MKSEKPKVEKHAYEVLASQPFNCGAGYVKQGDPDVMLTERAAANFVTTGQLKKVSKPPSVSTIPKPVRKKAGVTIENGEAS